MLATILDNLKLVGIAMAIFAGSVAANTLLGLYNNIRILLQPFDKKRLIDTALKTGVLVISIPLSFFAGIGGASNAKLCNILNNIKLQEANNV